MIGYDQCARGRFKPRPGFQHTDSPPAPGHVCDVEWAGGRSTHNNDVPLGPAACWPGFVVFHSRVHPNGTPSLYTDSRESTQKIGSASPPDPCGTPKEMGGRAL